MTGILSAEETLSLSEYWLNQESSRLLFDDISEDSIYEDDNEILDLAIDTFEEEEVNELLPSNCGMFVHKLSLTKSEEHEDGG